MDALTADRAIRAREHQRNRAVPLPRTALAAEAWDVRACRASAGADETRAVVAGEAREGDGRTATTSVPRLSRRVCAVLLAWGGCGGWALAACVVGL